MTRWFSSLIVLALCALGAPAEAGSVTGVITRLEQIVDTEAQGLKPFLLITINGTVNSPPPACNTSNRFALDLSTTTGLEAARLTHLLYATGRTARIGGVGLCGVYPGSETAAEVDGF